MRKQEIWKDIPSYENLYQISSYGRVKSLERHAKYRNNDKRTYFKAEKILRQQTNSDGYKIVKLYDGEAKGKNISVHRLLALSFIPNYHNLKMVNHIDGNPSNNNLENLEWCTHAYNVKHAYDNKLKNPKNYIGEASSTSKLTNDIVLEIGYKYGKNGNSYKKLAKEYNISPSNVFSIVKRKSWTHV